MATENMGLVYADVELVRGDDLALLRAGYLPEAQVRRVRVRAMVDSGATVLSMPAFVQQQLQLAPMGDIEAESADGSNLKLAVVGPVEVRFENRRTLVEALVVPNSIKILLGAIPMSGMDLLVDPKRERLVVNPESPNVAHMLLM